VGSTELEKIKDEDDCWEKVANYLAQGCFNLFLAVSPSKIVLGGGVMNRACLFPKVHAHFLELVNGYVSHPEVQSLIVPSGMKTDSEFHKKGVTAGLLGAALINQ
jgi:fructokinase